MISGPIVFTIEGFRRLTNILCYVSQIVMLLLNVCGGVVLVDWAVGYWLGVFLPGVAMRTWGPPLPPPSM